MSKTIETNNNYFTVTFPDGSTKTIGRFKRSDRKVVTELLDQLMTIFVGQGFATGEVICRDDAWSIMNDIAALLPVHGTDVKGIDLELIEDNDELLADIFLTTSRSKDGRIWTDGDNGWEPSHICRVNNLNYNGKLLDGYNASQAEREKKTKVLLSGTAEAVSPVAEI